MQSETAVLGVLCAFAVNHLLNPICHTTVVRVVPQLLTSATPLRYVAHYEPQDPTGARPSSPTTCTLSMLVSP